MLKPDIYDRLRKFICPFDKILEYIPKEGKILDIGSGYGTFALLMADSLERKIIGIELNKMKVELAKRRSIKYKNLEFISIDINNFKTKEKFDAIVLIDVLHHINSSYHEGIFRKIQEILADDGFLIIKEVDKKPLYKYLWNYFHDIVMNKSLRFYYLSNKEVKSHMKKNNFEVMINKNIGNPFYEHYLVVCKKAYISESG